MAHYPFYTHNLSLVGVCVKRIGKDKSIYLADDHKSATHCQDIANYIHS
jgi:hypothetical protein